MAQDDLAPVVRLYERLAEALQRTRRDPFNVPVTVAEIYQELVPYRLVRSEIGFDMNADYEHALLRLLAGEGERVRLEPARAVDELRRELRSSNPNLSMYRDYAACDVWVSQPAEPAAAALPLLDITLPATPTPAVRTAEVAAPDRATHAEPKSRAKGSPRAQPAPKQKAVTEMLAAATAESTPSREREPMRERSRPARAEDAGSFRPSGEAPPSRGRAESTPPEEPARAPARATSQERKHTPADPAPDQRSEVWSEPSDADLIEYAPRSAPDTEADGKAVEREHTAEHKTPVKRTVGEPPKQAAAVAAAPHAEMNEPPEPATRKPVARATTEPAAPSRPRADAQTRAEARCAFCDSALPAQRQARFCPYCGADQRMRPCGSCGEPVEPGWVFCIACGASAQ